MPFSDEDKPHLRQCRVAPLDTVSSTKTLSIYPNGRAETLIRDEDGEEYDAVTVYVAFGNGLTTQRAALLTALAESTEGSWSLDSRISHAIGQTGPSSDGPSLPYIHDVRATLRLVPADHSWTMSSGGHAEVVSESGKPYQGRAVTPLRALCIAALQARWAAEKDGL